MSCHNKKWGMKESYHLLLDSGKLGIDGVVDIIEKAYRSMAEKEQPKAEAEQPKE